MRSSSELEREETETDVSERTVKPAIFFGLRGDYIS